MKGFVVVHRISCCEGLRQKIHWAEKRRLLTAAEWLLYLQRESAGFALCMNCKLTSQGIELDFQRVCMISKSVYEVGNLHRSLSITINRQDNF